MPFPMGEKIRALRPQKRLSLEQLAMLTDSSKSYLWELENKDDPKPSADKIGRIAAVPEVTSDFLMSGAAPMPDVTIIDEAFSASTRACPNPTRRSCARSWTPGRMSD